MRVFVGIELPETIRARLAPLQAGVPGARWVRPENLHVTLHFLGELDGARLDDVDQALGCVISDPFELEVSGVGEFGGRKGPRAIWAALAPSEPLLRLHGRVAAALGRAGIETEARRYVPHITLARLRDAPYDRVARFVADHSMLSAGSWQVRRMVLFSSWMGAQGSDYRVEAGYDFDVAPWSEDEDEEQDDGHRMNGWGDEEER
jgi:2'-5' RNA ligase